MRMDDRCSREVGVNIPPLTHKEWGKYPPSSLPVPACKTPLTTTAAPSIKRKKKTGGEKSTPNDPSNPLLRCRMILGLVRYRNYYKITLQDGRLLLLQH